MVMVVLAFAAGVGFIVLLALGRYALDCLVGKIKSLRKPKTDVGHFLKKFGWQAVSCDTRVAIAPELPEESALPALMARFDKSGHCAVVEGSSWDVAVYQLNELLKIEPREYATKPPRPAIIKWRAQQGLPKSLRD